MSVKIKNHNVCGTTFHYRIVRLEWQQTEQVSEQFLIGTSVHIRPFSTLQWFGSTWMLADINGLILGAWTSDKTIWERFWKKRYCTMPHYVYSYQYHSQPCKKSISPSQHTYTLCNYRNPGIPNDGLVTSTKKTSHYWKSLIISLANVAALQEIKL